MNKEFHSLMVNETWDLVPLLKAKENFSNANRFIGLSMLQMVVLIDIIQV